MKHYDEIEKIAEQNDGMLRTAQIVQAGIPKPAFYNYLRESSYTKVSQGIYISPDAWTDWMYITHIRFPQAVFSHDTALFFHDLTDREPLRFSLTLKNGYNTSRMNEENIKVYTVKSELHDMGITTMDTQFGHPVLVYDIDRTICDIVRSRRDIEIQSFSTALKEYVRRRDKSLRNLSRYAEKLHVSRLVRQYMEVLL